MIYGYIRVSTDKQTVENQKYEIKKFCRRNKIKLSEINWIAETISGCKSPKKRKHGRTPSKHKFNSA
jgi:DNA invertase Pin-like site-specific DNA recombinase